MIRALFLLVLCLLLCGCPYTSKHPLTKAKYGRVDPKLLGNWELVDKEEKKKGEYIRVIPFNKHELLVVAAGRNKHEYGRAFTTEVYERKFLNFQELDKEDKDFMYLEYVIEDDQLKMMTVEDDLFKKKKYQYGDDFFDDFLKEFYNDKLVDDQHVITLQRVKEVKKKE